MYKQMEIKIITSVKNGEENINYRASENSSESISTGKGPRRLVALPRWMAMLILRPEKKNSPLVT